MSLATELATSTALSSPVPVTTDPPFSASRAPAPHQQDDGEDQGQLNNQTQHDDGNIDAARLRQALADAEAEEAAAAGGIQPQQAQAQQPSAATSPTQAQPAEGGDPNAPQATAFAALRRDNRTLRDQVAYWRGQAEARASLPAATGQQPPAQPQPAPQPTLQEAFAATRARVQQELRTLEDRIVALADKLDNGELTNRQYVEQELALRRDMQTLYLEDFAAWVKKEMPQPAPASLSLADEKLLEDQITELETKFPWSTVLTDAELSWLARQVEAEYAGRGQPLAPGPRKVFLVREGVAQLAQFYGPRWYPNAQVPQPQAQPGQQPPQNSVAPPQTAARPNGSIQPPTRAAQAAGKIALAASHPPTQGAPASGTPGVTEADIDNMSQEEIMALPPATRQRLLYGR